jgi:hypothetical protein
LILVFAYPAFAQDGTNYELGILRSVTARYHTIAEAQADNYDLVPGLDYCFDNPGVGGMGYHYINTSLLDITIDPLKPEALVYAPLSNEKLQLAAVEYIVPASAWDAVHSQPPTLYGQDFGLEQALGVYELHVWIWKNNPSGIFFEWNPDVVCR